MTADLYENFRKGAPACVRIGTGGISRDPTASAAKGVFRNNAGKKGIQMIIRSKFLALATGTLALAMSTTALSTARAAYPEKPITVVVAYDAGGSTDVTGGFAPSFSSIGLLGAPILMDAYGSSVAIPVMLLILFQSPLLFTTATMIAEAQRTAGGRPIAAAVNAVKATLLSPMILSIVVGMGFNLTGVHVPDAVMKAADYAAATVLPCACFTLGTALSFGKLSGKFGQALVLAVMKTVLHPVLTWVLAVEVFHLPPDWLAPAVTAAALPIGVNVYAFAERYQTGRELVSMSLLLSTLMSPISISVAFMVAMG